MICCGRNSSAKFGALTSRRPATVPLSSRKRSHFAISVAVENAAPADAMPSVTVDATGSTRTVSRTMPCGEETSVDARRQHLARIGIALGHAERAVDAAMHQRLPGCACRVRGDLCRHGIGDVVVLEAG